MSFEKEKYGYKHGLVQLLEQAEEEGEIVNWGLLL